MRLALASTVVGVVGLVGVGLAPRAQAQQIPPPESGPRLVDVQVVNDQVMIRASGTNKPIVMPRGIPLQDARGIPNALRAHVEIRPQPTGVDIVYRFRNDTGMARPVSDLRLGVITLGDRVTTQDMRRDSGPMSLSAQNHRVVTMNYPASIYSPVTIVRNDEFAVGVSIQYPIMEYKHDVACQLRSPDGRLGEGEGGRGWEVAHRLSNTSREPDKLYYSCMVPPGEQRTYVVSLRVTNRPEEWVRTLVPYRDYFRSKYGGVRYTRNVTPINAVPLAQATECSEQNPYGFRDQSRRPDVHGWGPLTSDLRAREDWPSIMLWLPTGCYKNNKELNFPFQFTSRWQATPQLATALDAELGLPSLVASGKQLGLWWGRAFQVARTWDPATNEKLDPDNPEHVEAAFRELDLAVQVGASLIGLDTSGHRQIPIWKSYGWIQRLQQRAPGVTFATEPLSCDIIHTITPTYLRGRVESDVTPRSMAEAYWIRNPHYLADFLLPGHETWGSFAYTAHRTHLNIPVTDSLVESDMERFAYWGYRPVFFTDLPMPDGQVNAAESWRRTVPADLQIAQRPTTPPPSNPGQGSQGSSPSTGPSSGGTTLGSSGGPGPKATYDRDQIRKAIRRAQGRTGSN